MSEGIQCRTMTSQRPCGNPQCTREECSGARESALAFTTGQEWADYLVSATNIGTENDSMPSESVPQDVTNTEPTYTFTGLTAGDIERLRLALYVLTESTVPGSSEWMALTDLSERLYRVDTD